MKSIIRGWVRYEKETPRVPELVAVSGRSGSKPGNLRAFVNHHLLRFIILFSFLAPSTSTATPISSFAWGGALDFRAPPIGANGGEIFSLGTVVLTSSVSEESVHLVATLMLDGHVPRTIELTVPSNRSKTPGTDSAPDPLDFVVTRSDRRALADLGNGVGTKFELLGLGVPTDGHATFLLDGGRGRSFLMERRGMSVKAYLLGRRSDAATIPEPATHLLLGTGFAAAGGLIVRRRRKANHCA